MLKNMDDPPLGFGSKCPDWLAFKKLIQMNQPIDDKGMVYFTTTLFALIQENLSVKIHKSIFITGAEFITRKCTICWKTWTLH